MIKQFIASTLIATIGFVGGGNTANAPTSESPRYEYSCDRIEHNYTTGRDIAVMEIYDTQTGTIKMVDIMLPHEC